MLDQPWGGKVVGPDALDQTRLAPLKSHHSKRVAAGLAHCGTDLCA